MEAQSWTSFCCFFAAACLVSHNWPLNVWYSVVIEHFGLQRAAQRSRTKFTASVILKTKQTSVNIPSGSETVITTVFNIRIVFLSSFERHWKLIFSDSDSSRCLTHVKLPPSKSESTKSAFSFTSFSITSLESIVLLKQTRRHIVSKLIMDSPN